MHRYRPFSFSALGIERVATREEIPVSRVDLMTRDAAHAAELEYAFGVRPFRFARSRETLFAFPRLPAVGARAWLEDHGLAFELTGGGLGRPDLTTWVQGGW